jgi:PKD repeat protein
MFSTRKTARGVFRRILPPAVPAVTAVTLLALCVPASAARAGAPLVRHVNNANQACSDRGTGSISSPYCTIQAAATAAQPGDTVLVAGGVYSESVTINHSGTASATITFSPEQGATVTVSGQAHAFTVSGTPTAPTSWIRITGFNVTNTASSGIYLKYADHITVDNNHVSSAGQPVSGATAQGIYLTGTTASLISNNVSDHNSDSGFYATGGTTGVEFRGNVAFANAREYTRAAPGIDIRAPGNVVDGNRTYDNEDSGIQFYSGASGSVAYNNVSYNNGDHGIDVLNSPNVVIVANSVYHNFTAGINVEGAATTPSTGATVRNNISAQNGLTSTTTRGELRVDANSQPGTTVDYDMLYASAPGTLVTWGWQQYTSVSVFTSAAGQELHALGANDPLWVSPDSGDFHLQAGSAAIDSANSNAPYQPTRDFDGNARVDDPATPNTGVGQQTYDDRGAFEFQPSTSSLIAQVSVSPSSGNPPLTVLADASGSRGAISTYQFSFGDGTGTRAQRNATASHTYNQAGSYTVTVTVTDVAGHTATASAPVNVGPAPSDSPPVAALTLSTSSGRAPLAVTADSSGSTDTDATPIVSYRFDFGDGVVVGPQAGSSASHTYSTPGSYTVTVHVTDAADQVSSASASITVLAAIGTQFFSNPGFENGVTGWNSSGRTGVTLENTADAHTGSSAALLTNTTAGSLPDCTLNDSPNAVLKTDPNGTYSASLWVTAPTAGVRLTLRIREYNGATFIGQTTAQVTLSTSWQQISVSYTSLKPSSTLDYTAYITNALPGVCFLADDAAMIVVS